MKKMCVVCGDKASILTRIRLNDGFLCNDCAKKCSEHLDDYDEITADEIKKHIEYREKNKSSALLKSFSATMSLGNYEILKIDQTHGTWLLETEKRFSHENPDIFLLSQIKDVSLVRKKECLNKFDDEAAQKLSSKFTRKKNRHPIYGFWFYIVIRVDHPFFSEIDMRVNKYIISEKNQIEYLSAVRTAQDIIDIITELAEQSKAKHGDSEN